VALQLSQIVESLGGVLHGRPQQRIEGLASLESATDQQISFLSHPKYQSQLQSSAAACVIVAPAFEAQAVARGDCIVTPDPYLYFARLTQLWKRSLPHAAAPGVHPSAVVDPTAQIDPSAVIGPLCVVERGARIGAHTVLKSRISIGEDCVVHADHLLDVSTSSSRKKARNRSSENMATVHKLDSVPKKTDTRRNLLSICMKRKR
jgi:UDP-3-O-[3-hydroxymyristoyl] glucosamine N-acyltransferase